MVQDTMVRALRYAHQFQPGTNLGAWLNTIMRRAHIDNWRRSHPDDESLDVMPPDATDVTAAGSPHRQLTDGRGADEEALARIGIAEVLEALKDMPPHYAEILQLVVIEDVPYEEAARRLGLSLGTVYSSMFRARQRLRKLGLGEG